MASAGLRKELDCSICLDLYTDPVTLRCGHNFCRGCIDRVLDTQDGSGVYFCPECRAEFQKRPVLQKNITLCKVVENFSSTHPHQEVVSGIFCTYCFHSPVPAVKSCLLCEASLCDNHLKVHSKSPEHVLTDPSTSLEKRKCSIHKKILEYYCTEDAACICVSCSLAGEHRGHRVEMLDEASENKKKKLRNVLQKLMTKRKKTEERVQSLEEHRRKAQEKASGEGKRVTALFIDIRRWVDDLEKRILSEISRQKEKMSLSLSDAIQKLEIKKDELSRKMRHIEELCNMMDPLTVLQDPDTGDLCDPEEGGGDDDTGDLCDPEEGGGDEDTGDLCDPEEGGGDDDTGRHNGGYQGLELISHISNTLSAIIRDVNITFCTQGLGMLLDVDTAHYKIHISNDKKTATYTTVNQNYPDNSQWIGSQQTADSSSFQDFPQGCSSSFQDFPQGCSSSFQDFPQGCSSSFQDFPQGCSSSFQNFPQGFSSSFQDFPQGFSTSFQDFPQGFSSSFQNVPQGMNSSRFQLYHQVMSSSCLASGRCYWDVEIKESKNWKVGMCYSSIERSGHQSHLGDNHKSWVLCREQRYSVRYGGKVIQLPHRISSDRVRICLDYEGGQLSFYELCDPIRHLHTFTATFTEPLHAVLCVHEGSLRLIK